MPRSPARNNSGVAAFLPLSSSLHLSYRITVRSGKEKLQKAILLLLFHCWLEWQHFSLYPSISLVSEAGSLCVAQIGLEFVISSLSLASAGITDMSCQIWLCPDLSLYKQPSNPDRKVSAAVLYSPFLFLLIDQGPGQVDPSSFPPSFWEIPMALWSFSWFTQIFLLLLPSVV